MHQTTLFRAPKLTFSRRKLPDSPYSGRGQPLLYLPIHVAAMWETCCVPLDLIYLLHTKFFSPSTISFLENPDKLRDHLKCQGLVGGWWASRKPGLDQPL